MRPPGRDPSREGVCREREGERRRFLQREGGRNRQYYKGSIDGCKDHDRDGMYYKESCQAKIVIFDLGMEGGRE